MEFFPDFNLSGRTALVTGSSRGIGKAIAFALAAAGAEVILHASKNSGPFDAARKEAERAAFRFRMVTGDLATEDGLQSVIRGSSPVDILVLNASVQMYQPVPELSWPDFERQMRVNVGSSFRLIQSLVPAMTQRRWGRVLAIGSVNQWKQSPRLPAYACTKSALSNLMQNCARTYAPDGVTFNTLAPGVIATDRNRETLSDPQKVESLLKNIPSGRFGQPADCAGLALLLCSPAGGYITGTDIPVAGGMQL